MTKSFYIKSLYFFTLFLISNISGKAECVSHVDFSANTVIDYNNKIEFEIQTEES